jgi:glycosidase
VILDIVTNHLGQLFYYDINENGVPDINVYGAGCPPAQLNRGCTNPQITQLTEYDPDYDPNGIQAYTSLGFAGPAPVKWLYLPEIHRMPPLPTEFQNKDWYNKRGRIVDYTNVDHQPTEQVMTGDFPGGLKDVKTTDPDVQAAMIKAYAYWIGAADFDAFRIDTLKHVEHVFWQKFAPGVRTYAKQAGKKNFFMFGEAFDGDDQLVGSYTFNDEVDGAFYFPQKFTVWDGVFKHDDPTKNIETLWTARDRDYDTKPHTDGPVDANGNGVGAPQLLVNFLDNHDIPRFAFDKPCIGPGNCPALWSALGTLLMEQGIPCVYYGTEQEFAGGNDPANRERLWDTGFPVTGKTFQYIRAMIDLRRKYRPLRHGVTQVKWSTTRVGSERDAGIFAFERVDGDDGKRALVVVNVKDDKAGSTRAPDDQGGGKMSVGWAPGTQVVQVAPDPVMGIVAGDMLTVGADGTIEVSVPARRVSVYVAASDAAGIAPLDEKP